MNKTELIAAIAEKTELSKKDAEKALKAFTDVVAEELKKGEKIQLVGFGTFEIRETAAREGINPQTGAKIKIAASKKPAFKAGKAFKDGAFEAAILTGFFVCGLMPVLAAFCLSSNVPKPISVTLSPFLNASTIVATIAS